MSAAGTPEGKKPEIDLTAAAERQVDRLLKAVRRGRIWTAVLSLVVVCLVVLGWQQYTLVRATHNGAITSCEKGNDSRQTNKDSWDAFINLLVTNPNTAKTRAALLAEVARLGLPTADVQALDAIINANWTNSPANVALARGFENYIAAHEYPVNCAQAYKS